MKVLLHICCGPCAITPIKVLRAQGYEVEGFFYNPNIHPYSEYKKRFEAVVAMAGRMNLNVVHHRYDFEEFLRRAATLTTREAQHQFCWSVRLEETAKKAKLQGIPFFTSTLLVSPYQDIEEIKRIGEKLAKDYGLTFLALDFRKGFHEGHKISKEWQLYHQNYCGCIYSEKESIEQRERKTAK